MFVFENRKGLKKGYIKENHMKTIYFILNYYYILRVLFILEFISIVIIISNRYMMKLSQTHLAHVETLPFFSFVTI